MKQIPLTQGKFALIDDEDFEWLMSWKWYCAKGYAVRKKVIEGKRFVFPMHREIMLDQLSEIKTEVDHINRNKLDNRRENLRVCTRKENCRNRKSRSGSTSKYLGVSKSGNKWHAQIEVNGMAKHLGFFSVEEDAAIAYNQAALLNFGAFANLNKI